MTVLIDRMNEMQLDALKDPDFKPVKQVNLRNTLDAVDHTTMWAMNCIRLKKGSGKKDCRSS